jgi:hypothetical protein
MSVIAALEILDEIRDDQNRTHHDKDFMKNLIPSQIKGILDNLVRKQFKVTERLRKDFDKLAKHVGWEKEELTNLIIIHPNILKNDNEDSAIIWREMRHMIVFYIENFINDPLGTVTKETFLLNSRVAAKILSNTEIFAMNKDVNENSTNSAQFRENLKIANEKSIELNITRTVGFRAELPNEMVIEQIRKITELEKLFDGFLQNPGEIEKYNETMISTHNVLIPNNAQRMKMV